MSSEKLKKNEFLQIRMDKDLKRRVEAEAEKKGLKAAQLVRMWIIEKLEKSG
ncbi:hypothetical protein KKI24_07160 [bacterium]|nr:hypothetical protein [bacterium]